MLPRLALNSIGFKNNLYESQPNTTQHKHSAEPIRSRKTKSPSTQNSSNVFDRLYQPNPLKYSNEQPQSSQSRRSKRSLTQDTSVYEKLVQKDIVSKKRIEILREKTTQEQMSHLKQKPYVSKKSKELAKRAEMKFLQEFSVCDEKGFMENIPFLSSPEQKEPEPFLTEEASQQKSRKDSYRSNFTSGPVKAFDLDQTLRSKTPRCKPRLYEMSAIERNKVWLQNKQQKINQKQEEKFHKSLDECTFEPVFYSQIPKSLHDLPAKSIHSISKSPNSTFMSFSSYSTPKKADSVSDFHRPTRYCSLSPYKVNVAHKSGFDMGSFLARAQ